MEAEKKKECACFSVGCSCRNEHKEAPLQHGDYKIVSRTNSMNSTRTNSNNSNTTRSNSGGNQDSFAMMSASLLQEISAQILTKQETNSISEMKADEQNSQILVLEGEIPLGIDCFSQWKTVIGCERKIDFGLFEFSLQDKECNRLGFQEGIQMLQQSTRFKFPALQIFIEKFALIHEKRVTRRIKAQSAYSKLSVLHEFVSEFQKQFTKRTDKVIKSLLESSSGYLITLRCRWNIDTGKHEFYKIGFSTPFISLLGVDPETLCYDFMKNGVRNFLDEESLLNLSSVLICYHMTRCLQERKTIIVHLKTYDGLVLPTSCSIMFHAEKMDEDNSYFESIVTLNFTPDPNIFSGIQNFRLNQELQLDQDSQQSTSASLDKREIIKKQLTPINSESLQNNKLILEKFYGFSFQETKNSSKICRIKFI